MQKSKEIKKVTSSEIFIERFTFVGNFEKKKSHDNG
jgi:hypothetical protein